MAREDTEFSSKEGPLGNVAYLVVREGTNWRDVFRLTPGQVTTVGRAPTNRIVLRDDVCSRNHCEVFQSGAHWTLRDLGSRNGTTINSRKVAGDWELEDGQLIQIGSCELGFTFDLSKPFPESQRPIKSPNIDDTAYEVVIDHFVDDGEEEVESPPSIIHRKRDTRYRSEGPNDSMIRDRASRELASLYQLTLAMGEAPETRTLTEVVLDGLFKGTSADIGAVLLLSKGKTSQVHSAQLQVLSYRSTNELPYQRLSDRLARVVLESREAVLARDVSDDSRVINRDSSGEIHARSVICAPIRSGAELHGLIHLYTTNPDNPFDPDDLEFTLAVADQLAVALENMQQRQSLADGLQRAKDENRTLRQQLEMEFEIVGEHPSIQRLRQNIERMAPTDATVLIRGESGVGKELVARAIHFNSNRRNGPFTTMNCAALSETLLESELFGHEKGSFTGAVGRKIGKFEQADGGSLFLDEVGEMSLPIQAKFLRVLEGHPFERIGGGTQVDVDVRVVAATNRDLEQAIQEGTFRSDLYFRLHVVEILVPPLRDHASDIPLLAEHFLKRIVRKNGRPVRGFSEEAMELLRSYEWPGNIRQLQNAVERAVILCASDHIDRADLQLSALSPTDSGVATIAAEQVTRDYQEMSLEMLERDHILKTLESTGWNKSKAAQILGIERSTLDRKLKKYDVSRPH